MSDLATWCVLGVGLWSGLLIGAFLTALHYKLKEPVPPPPSPRNRHVHHLAGVPKSSQYERVA